MSRSCQVLRVFTQGERGGNHLGVVNDRSGLDALGMQKIATDLGFSETVFVDWFDRSRPPRVRIFTPGMELPFAGHPLVGAAWVLAVLGPGPDSGVLECDAGVVTFRRDGEAMWVDAAVVDASVEPPDDALGFLADAGLPEPGRVHRVMLPLEYVIAHYESGDAVSTALPDVRELAARFGTLLVHREGEKAHVRFFAPAAGVVEDPATGSAAVALAAALVADGEERGDLVISQGSEMGHPSQIRLSWSPRRVEIGGTVVRDEVRFLDA